MRNQMAQVLARLWHGINAAAYLPSPCVTSWRVFASFQQLIENPSMM